MTLTANHTWPFYGLNICDLFGPTSLNTYIHAFSQDVHSGINSTPVLSDDAFCIHIQDFNSHLKYDGVELLCNIPFIKELADIYFSTGNFCDNHRGYSRIRISKVDRKNVFKCLF